MIKFTTFLTSYYTIMFMLPAVPTAAQFHTWPVAPHPDPLQLPPHYKDINTTGTKKVLRIKNDIDLGVNCDTLDIELYNTQGQLVKFIQYIDNKPYCETLYTHSQPGNEPGTELHFYNEPDHIRRTVFTHDSLNILIKKEDILLNLQGDTLDYIVRLYEYNKQKLTAVKIVENDTTTLAEAYYYTGNRLDSTIIYRRKKLHAFEIYVHDAMGRLAISERHEYWDGRAQRVLVSRATRTYDNENRILSDSMNSFWDTADNKFNYTYYRYDDAGRLAGRKSVYKDREEIMIGRMRSSSYSPSSSFHIFPEDQIQSIEEGFTYSRNKIIGIQRIYNLAINIDSKFRIPGAEANAYEIQLLYDGRENIIAKRTFSGGVLIGETVFEVEYY